MAREDSVAFSLEALAEMVGLDAGDEMRTITLAGTIAITVALLLPVVAAATHSVPAPRWW